jgi:hypothetical protein
MPNLRAADAFPEQDSHLNPKGFQALKNQKIIGAAMCIAALAVPAVASAGKPDNPGSQGKGHSNKTLKRCGHQPKVGYILGGKLAAGSTASSIKFSVVTANKFAKSLKGTDVTLSDAPFSYTAPAKIVGTSPFGTDGALTATDPTVYKVKVIGKITKFKKGCNLDNTPAPITVKKVTIIGPDSSQAPEQETQQPQS